MIGQELLNTQWDQVDYNNNSPSCPLIPYYGETYYGCTAIALGQIVNYYNYPNTNINFYSYELLYCPHETIPFTNYNEYTNTFPDLFYQGNLFGNNIDEFLYNIAVSILTVFKPGAGSYKRKSPIWISSYENEIMLYRLKNDFGYSDQAQWIDRSVVNNDVGFREYVKGELLECRPVLLRTWGTRVVNGENSEESGHALVIDGYSNDKYHINFGWGGYHDGWYDDFLYLDLEHKNANAEDISIIYNSNQEILVKLFPEFLIEDDVCSYTNSLQPHYNIISNHDKIIPNKKNLNQCPTVLFPSNNTILNHKIEFIWSNVSTAQYYSISIYNIDKNTFEIDEYFTYGGYPSINLDQHLTPNSNFQVKIKSYNNSGLINSCTYNYQTSTKRCDIKINFTKKYCVNDGTEYVVEVDFTGENTTYDLYANWDGNTLDSKNSITPGFYILGPFDINQNVGIIIQDEENPDNCYDSELINSPTVETNCVVDPIISNNGGSSGNGNVTCNPPSNFTYSKSNTEITYTWSWPTNAQSIIIEESYDGINIINSLVLHNAGGSAVINNYEPCQTFMVRARIDCGQNFSTYTTWQTVNLQSGCANDPDCPMPTGVNHSINTSGAQDVLNVHWDSDGNSHEICFTENGNTLPCNTYNFNQTSTGIFMTDCNSYSYSIRSLCGTINSNWVIANEGITPGNNCGALTDLFRASQGNLVITSTNAKVEDVEIKNNGNHSVNVQMDLYLRDDSNSPTNGDRYFLSSRTRPIAANSSYTSDFGYNYIFDIQIPEIQTQSKLYKLEVVIDPNNEIPENSEGNNTYSIATLIYGCNDTSGSPVNYSSNANIIFCYYCNDGIKNGNEVEVDCGGSYCLDCCNNIYFLDNDGDGFGDDTQSIIACTPPNGYVTNGIDCNDNDADIFPANYEICDGKDNDCNGQTDECCETYYIDNDEDGYGGNTTIQSCIQLFNYVTNNSDCNDNNSAVFPNATEACDNLDNNCNSQIDEGNICTTPGDNCSNAIQLLASRFYTSNGPNSGFGANNSDHVNVEHADWYYFTALEDGFINIDACYGGVDTRLIIYEGSCSNLSLIGNNLDTWDNQCRITQGGANYASSAQFLDVKCGTTYYFEWDDRWSEDGFDFYFELLSIADGSCIDSYKGLSDLTFETSNTNFIYQESCFDDMQWLRYTGPPPSRINGVQTGPLSAHEGDYYFYVESSVPNHPNKAAIFQTRCTYLGYHNFPMITFWYHMYGSDMGTLKIEISDDYGATWERLVSFSGDKGDQWNYVRMFLTTNGNDYWANEYVSFRFTATTSSGFKGDIAIDNIKIEEFCSDQEIVDYDINSNSIYIEANSLVRANKKVAINSNATFDSGNTIELTNGFEVMQGATFLAKIDGCDLSPNNLQSETSIKK